VAFVNCDDIRYYLEDRTHLGLGKADDFELLADTADRVAAAG
jgi:hypothetical protein